MAQSLGLKAHLKSRCSCSYSQCVPAMPAHLTISELAARSGAAPSALRYYEDLGLITAERTTGNQRRYARYMLRRVAFIKAGRRLGLSLGEVKVALDRLPSGKAPTRAEWRRAAKMWQERIRAKIDDIGRVSSAIGSCN